MLLPTSALLPTVKSASWKTYVIEELDEEYPCSNDNLRKNLTSSEISTPDSLPDMLRELHQLRLQCSRLGSCPRLLFSPLPCDTISWPKGAEFMSETRTNLELAADVPIAAMQKGDWRRCGCRVFPDDLSGLCDAEEEHRGASPVGIAQALMLLPRGSVGGALCPRIQSKAPFHPALCRGHVLCATQCKP